MESWKASVVGALIGCLVGSGIPHVFVSLSVRSGAYVFFAPLAILALPRLNWATYIAISAINWGIYGTFIGYIFTKIEKAWKKGAILGFVCGIAISCITIDTLFLKYVAHIPSSVERGIINAMISALPILLSTVLGSAIGFLCEFSERNR